MRTKGSRGRGRPSGKYHSLADLRILEYLALISMKYGTSPDDFFDGFVEAWKHQESTRKSLLIECRKRTRDYAVFLITNSCKVVAQFPIPKHILEKINPLKEIGRARESERAIAKRAKVKHLRIRDLKSGMNQVKLEARVLKISKPTSVVTRFGRLATVTTISITDQTGIIELPLWNQQIHSVSVGDLVQVENARVVTFRGERQLKVGRSGQLSVVEKK